MLQRIALEWYVWPFNIPAAGTIIHPFTCKTFRLSVNRVLDYQQPDIFCAN